MGFTKQEMLREMFKNPPCEDFDTDDDPVVEESEMDQNNGPTDAEIEEQEIDEHIDAVQTEMFSCSFMTRCGEKCDGLPRCFKAKA